MTLAEGDITPNDHLLVELDDGQRMPQVVLIHWPVKATAVRTAAYGDTAAKAMRLLANADVELARLRRTRGRPKVDDHDRQQAPRSPHPADRRGQERLPDLGHRAEGAPRGEARMADDEVFQFHASASGCIGGLGALHNS
jgi:hypothetical protein